MDMNAEAKADAQAAPLAGKDSLLRTFLHSRRAAPYLFVLPFIASFLLFFLYPVGSTIIMSFQEVLPGETHFVGLDNYEQLFNRHYYRAVFNSTVYTILTLLVLIPLPLVLAVFLNSHVMKAKNFFRSVLFVPALTSVVVAGTIFRLIFGELDSSLANTMIGWFGIDSQKWMSQPVTAMLVLVLLATWRWTGINTVYFLSGLQGIPHELYESADIDGASAWDKFISITLPQLRPVTIYVLTISIYGGFAMFTESYMMYSGQGSPNDIGLTMVGYIYKQGLEQFQLGFGSAIGITLLLFTLVLNLIQLRFFGLFRQEEA